MHGQKQNKQNETTPKSTKKVYIFLFVSLNQCTVLNINFSSRLNNIYFLLVLQILHFAEIFLQES